MTKIFVTGHRPEKITDWQYVGHQLALAFHDYDANVVIQGCAAGVDMLAARVAFHEHIPFWSIRPWAGHKPRKADEQDYAKMLANSAYVHDVSDQETYPGAWIYQKRNEWMVDNGDIGVAVWDGSPGGTANCVKYALAQEKRLWNINPATHKVGWLI
jgi:uncharacterized phage-like protein YoqJ